MSGLFSGSAAGAERAAPQTAKPTAGGDDIAARAIGFAQQNGTPLTPEIFEVWYTYAARENKVVNETIDLALNTGEGLSAEGLRALYHAHVSPRSMSDELSDIGAVLQAAIGNVTNAMDENLREHSVFSGTLRNARQSLVQGSSKRDVTDVIKQLHRANQEHLQAAQRLTVQLEKNRGQVAKLKGELIEARKVANTDYLTGLPNRRVMDEHMDDALFHARQRKQPLCLLMAQVDNLDRVAREYGVTASDNILKILAENIRVDQRGGQVTARFAGAKFAVLLPDSDAESGFMVAEAIRKRFKTLDWVTKDGGQQIGVLTISFGGAVLAAGDTRATMIERADNLLVQAQRQGMDRTIIQ